MNLLRDRVGERNAELSRAVDEMPGREIGPDDAGIAKLARLLGERAALRFVQFAENDRKEWALDGALPGAAESPTTNGRESPTTNGRLIAAGEQSRIARMRSWRTSSRASAGA
jgi:hypothetical protein